jgi:ribosomal protein S18 acetylase RimI-like enzyme
MSFDLKVIRGIKCQPSSELSSQQINSLLELIHLCFQKQIKIGYLLSNCDTYILCTQSQTIACVQVEFETSRRHWLQHVCTHPLYRNQGRMKHLLGIVIAETGKRYHKVHQLCLAVHPRAVIAQGLYFSLGFKKRRRHANEMKYNYTMLDKN